MSMSEFTASGTSASVLSAPVADSGSRTVDQKRCKDYLRVHRRGSLPLKKRRVISLDDTTSDQGLVWRKEESPRHCIRIHRSSSLPPLIPTSSTPDGTSFSLLKSSSDFSFSKINVLSLIASAVVATEATMDVSVSPPGLAALSYASENSEELRLIPHYESNAQQCDEDEGSNKQRVSASSSFEGNIEMEQYNSNNSVITRAPRRTILPRHEDTVRASLEQPTDIDSVPPHSLQSGPGTLNNPRLRKRNVSPATPMAETSVAIIPPQHGTSGGTSTACKKTAALSAASLAVPEQPATLVSTANACPDKRCSGHADEIRCSATTTRGRACAYIAIGQTKYCRLHADYDTNPAPRRKSRDFGEDPEASIEDSSVEDELTEAVPQLLRCEPLPNVKVKQRTLTPVAKTEEKSSSSSTTGKTLLKKRLRRTSAKLAEKHADSPRALLSMIATDQWFGKTVQIAIGPLEGRRGIVEKWGNGWVSVLVQEAGLHNRRSFELYIDDDEGNKSPSSNGGIVHDNPMLSLPDVKVHKQRIPFKFSRDVVSPSPSSDSNKSSSSLGSPLPKMSKQSPLSLEWLVSPCRPNMMSGTAAFFPETPRTTEGQMSMDCSETPIPTKDVAEAASKFPLPKVTPLAERITSSKTCHSLSLQEASSVFDLQLPDASSARKDSSNTTKGMVFRPSMGERTRGRTVCSSEDDEEDTRSARSTTSATLIQRTKNRDHFFTKSSTLSSSR